MVTRFSILLIDACALMTVLVAGKKVRDSKDGAWLETRRLRNRIRGS